MRAVIYARYSSDLQRDASIEDQVRVCRRRIDAEGWSLGASIRIMARAGPRTCGRAIRRCLAARGSKFDVVVAESLDRLSRDQEHVAALFKRLRSPAIKLVTIGEGEIGACTSA